MKPIQLQLVSEGKTIAKKDLDPALQLRLRVYALTNEIPLVDMIELGLRFAVYPDSDAAPMHAPDDDEILDLAAGLLMAKTTKSEKPRRPRRPRLAVAA